MTAKAQKAENKVKPEVKFTYKVGDTEKSIFMSYELLNRLSHACPNVEQLQAISIFPDLQSEIVKQVLAPTVTEKDEDGEEYDRPAPEKFKVQKHTKDMTAETIQDIITWAVGHMTDFMIGLMDKNLNSATAANVALNDLAEKAKKIQEAQAGSTSGSAA